LLKFKLKNINHSKLYYAYILLHFITPNMITPYLAKNKKAMINIIKTMKEESLEAMFSNENFKYYFKRLKDALNKK
jgi:hypothetical protein